MPLTRLARPVAERFWERVSKGAPEKCWPWQGTKDAQGYGLMMIGSRLDGSRKLVLAHRLAWMLHHREEAELCVLHHCDNPPCCNPDHLFLGTRADNSADKLAKGRARTGRGEHVPRSRLTEGAVRDMRLRHAAGTRTIDLAREYGVSHGCARHAIAGLSWAWVKRDNSPTK